MRVRDLSGYRELLYAALIIFSAVSLATLEFLKNVYPSAVDIALVPKTTVVYMIVLVQVLPALLLLSADRLIAARDNSGRHLRVFRSVLFGVALLLILRQLQLYWGPAKDFTDSVSSSGWVLERLVYLTFLAALVGLAIWAFRGLVLFFLYMAPVAIVMTAILPSQVPTGGSPPETSFREVVTATQTESKPAVFILIFDELEYDVFLDDWGELDAESFPNIAALAQDGVWFANATTNDNSSINVLPAIIDRTISLAEHFNIRLYTQYLRLEQLYVNDCGQVMTCRGAGYLTENDQLQVAGQLALRSFYQATPEWVESKISRPMGWLLDRLGWAYPSVDGRGGHLLTKRQFSVFLDDIKGRMALGRIHVLHLMLPHDPFAFDEEGNAATSRSSYRQQSMFMDVLAGKLINRLKREGIYDETVIFLTGDHGWRTMVPSPETPPIPSIPHVPLVIHAPGLSSDVSDVDYQHVDFGPTLTDILGLPPPNDTEGDARRLATRRQQISPRVPPLLLQPSGFAVSAFSTERPQRDKVFFDFPGNMYVYSQEDGSWHFRRSDTGAATDDDQPTASDQEAIDRSDTGTATDWHEQLPASDQEAIETLARRSIEFLPAGKWPSLYDSLTGEFQHRCPREQFDQAGVEAAAQLGDNLRLLMFERLESVTIEDSSAQAVITGEIVGQGEYQIQAMFQKEAGDWKIAPAPDTQGCEAFGRLDG